MSEILVAGLESAIDSLLAAKSTSPQRLVALADLLKQLLDDQGLPGVVGGSGGELSVPGLSRAKNWDVAYEFAGKFRLLVSLKSVLKNLSGAIPNRIDDLQGELANVQHLRPEVVTGYVVIVDIAEDSLRKNDGLTWADHFEVTLRKLAIRKAPLWNQGLMEGLWFIRVDSRAEPGKRLVQPHHVAAEGTRFVRDLLAELKLREPAIPLR